MVDYFGRSKKKRINSIDEGPKQFLSLDDLEDVYDFSKQAEEESLYCFKAMANGLYKREKLPFATELKTTIFKDIDIKKLPEDIQFNVIKTRDGLNFIEDKIENRIKKLIPPNIPVILFNKDNKELIFKPLEIEIDLFNIPKDTIVDNLKFINVNKKLKIINVDKNLIDFDFNEYFKDFIPNPDAKIKVISNGMIDCYMFFPQKIKNRTLIIRQLHTKKSYFGEHTLKAKAIIDLPIEIEYNLKKEKNLITSFPIGAVLIIEGEVLENKHHNKLITFITPSVKNRWPKNINPYSGSFTLTITRNLEGRFLFYSEELYPHDFTMSFFRFNKLYLGNGYYIKSIKMKF